MTTFHEEVARGDRFEFGKNWSRFLKTLNEERIVTAEESLRSHLGVSDLSGRTFLDIGCGSGLLSLAARRLGALVHSLDFDPASVNCARELKRIYFPEDPAWTVEQASVLDTECVGSLGKFDIVYSWGVLHHTGAMHQALANAALAVRDGGRLFVAIYNHQPRKSLRWTRIKKFYCSLPGPAKVPFTAAMMAPRELKLMFRYLVTLRPHKYIRLWKEYSRKRGMSRWHDYVDWLGGYPFETARPEEIIHIYRELGFYVEHLKTVGGGSGCNEFVFRKSHDVLARSASPPTLEIGQVSDSIPRAA